MLEQWLEPNNWLICLSFAWETVECVDHCFQRVFIVHNPTVLLLQIQRKQEYLTLKIKLGEVEYFLLKKNTQND